MEFKNLFGKVPNISYVLPPILSNILDDKKETHNIFCKDRDTFHNNLIKFSVFIADYQHNFIKNTKFLKGYQLEKSEISFYYACKHEGVPFSIVYLIGNRCNSEHVFNDFLRLSSDRY